MLGLWIKKIWLHTLLCDWTVSSSSDGTRAPVWNVYWLNCLTDANPPKALAYPLFVWSRTRTLSKWDLRSSSSLWTDTRKFILMHSSSHFSPRLTNVASVAVHVFEFTYDVFLLFCFNSSFTVDISLLINWNGLWGFRAVKPGSR